MQSLKAQRGFLEVLGFVVVDDDGVEAPEDVEGTGVVEVGVEVEEASLNDMIVER